MTVRIILRRDWQSGDGVAEAPSYKTIDIEAPRVEAHMMSTSPHPWVVVGAEVIDGGER